MTGWRIVGWERYEVNYRGRAWTPGDTKRLGPLAYIRWQVNASNPRNDGWDRLLRVAGSRRVIIAYGVFGKCLEMVAELPWYARDGAIRVKVPTATGPVWSAATAEDICRVTGASLRHVRTALPILSDPTVCWLAEGEIDTIPERPGAFRSIPEPSETPSEVQVQSQDQAQGQDKGCESPWTGDLAFMLHLKDEKTYANYADNQQLREQLPTLWPAWNETYAVDIEQEIRKARLWELANPQRRKVDKVKFLTNWLNRAQDGGRPAAEPQTYVPPKGAEYRGKEAE